MELVDIGDLKSLDQCDRGSSTLPIPTKFNKEMNMEITKENCVEAFKGIEVVVDDGKGKFDCIVVVDFDKGFTLVNLDDETDNVYCFNKEVESEYINDVDGLMLELLNFIYKNDCFTKEADEDITSKYCDIGYNNQVTFGMQNACALS